MNEQTRVVGLIVTSVFAALHLRGLLSQTCSDPESPLATLRCAGRAMNPARWSEKHSLDIRKLQTPTWQGHAVPCKGCRPALWDDSAEPLTSVAPQHATHP